MCIQKSAKLRKNQEEYNESQTISKTNLREMQDNQKTRQGYGNLPKPQAQTKTRLTLFIRAAELPKAIFRINFK